MQIKSQRTIDFTCVLFVFFAAVFGVAVPRKPAYWPSPTACQQLLKQDLPSGFVVRVSVPSADLLYTILLFGRSGADR